MADNHTDTGAEGAQPANPFAEEQGTDNQAQSGADAGAGTAPEPAPEPASGSAPPPRDLNPMSNSVTERLAMLKAHPKQNYQTIPEHLKPKAGPEEGAQAKKDPDFKEHGPANAASGQAAPPAPAGPTGMVSNRRFRIAERFATVTDKLFSQLNGWLHERDPKHFRASAPDFATLARSFYDWLEEKKEIIKEEYDLWISLLVIYGVDTLMGIGHRIGKLLGFGAKEPQPAAPSDLGTRNASPEAKERPLCKLPGCGVAVDEGRHFCNGQHSNDYRSGMAKKHWPDFKSFAYREGDAFPFDPETGKMLDQPRTQEPARAEA